MLQVEPFTFKVSEADLTDLNARLDRARFDTEEIVPGADFEYGVPLEWTKQTTQYWRKQYDWRKHEAYINSFPHFTTKLDRDSITIHFIHVKSSQPDAIPLLACHGWPGSVYEFFKAIKPLTEPGKGKQAFHLVIPSMPGFLWSQRPTKTGWTMIDTARIFNELMLGLGYDKYGVQAGDWGSIAVRCMAAKHPQHCIAAHLNFLPAKPPGPLKLLPLSPWLIERMPWFVFSAVQRDRILRTLRYLQEGSGYYAIQSTKPATLGHALMDSPVGLLSWIGEKFFFWKEDEAEEDAISLDDVLTMITLYWFTKCSTTSFLPYKEHGDDGFLVYLHRRDLYMPCPTAVSGFPGEIANNPERWAKSTANIKWWKMADRGGHFAALEETDIYVDHVQDAFSKIWPLKRSSKL
ncbi:uncharacterized protein L969DRAFT_87727 [Mixia osmundae IAM 14324]|uniref:Epoxide hydrolase N-terminal domain-containing protein n=1 Tax=Mixia osmundae (strain CBS 9802 / IAM 14324 / JCM 22182 / KY 12970) TaxID=764103 RepID=G7E471_MIXOS|nr:uncharacterized protein L969DRAFT_87727 [Mixia osmundae IAM 14324]KEI39727.1 hypothetical protein L969DRAFT_87727 [Mixia osmundae IAM 14324]GAA97631.1 hypothetical protein E5Q_04309 [Mixia osmundae IAM 14324]